MKEQTKISGICPVMWLHAVHVNLISGTTVALSQICLHYQKSCCHYYFDYYYCYCYYHYLYKHLLLVYQYILKEIIIISTAHVVIECVALMGAVE